VRSESGGPEGDKTTGHLKGGGSSRAEPRGLGGTWRRSFPSPERVAPRLRLEFLPLWPERTERPVAERVAWEARGQRERVGCVAHEAKGSDGSTGQ